MRRCLLVFCLALLCVGAAPPPAAAQTYIGQIILVSFNFPPRGYAQCNGQLLAINQNQALFSLLGTTYGGNGTTNFALPDLRGRVPISVGQGPALSSRTLGERSGDETVTLTVAQLPAHSHTAMAASTANDQINPGSGDTWGVNPRLFLYSSGPTTAMNAGALGNAGGGQPHTNLKPYLTLNYVIALQGIFPTRD